MLFVKQFYRVGLNGERLVPGSVRVLTQLDKQCLVCVCVNHLHHLNTLNIPTVEPAGAQTDNTPDIWPCVEHLALLGQLFISLKHLMQIIPRSSPPPVLSFCLCLLI